MGYLVSIVRTGGPERKIRQEEIVSVVEGKFGFELERDDSGTIVQASREADGEEVVIFYDGSELWTKNPSEWSLGVMIEVAAVLGNGARVRGDEGETYENVTKTYTHPDDAKLIERPRMDWKGLLSWAPPVIAVLVLVYAVGKYLARYLMNN
jgi:hypothetical protein